MTPAFVFCSLLMVDFYFRVVVFVTEGISLFEFVYVSFALVFKVIIPSFFHICKLLLLIIICVDIGRLYCKYFGMWHQRVGPQAPHYTLKVQIP